MKTDIPPEQTGTPIPSPLATGGSGERFEQRVDAFALALLLVGATPPVLLDTRLVEVAFQTRRLGWETDDLLLVGEVAPGVHRKLAVQAKRTFTLAQSDEDCCKTLRAMWHDFLAADRFNPDSDRLAIATLHGTTVLLGHFQALLATARAASSIEDFQARLRTKGAISQTALNKYDTVQAILRVTEAEQVTDELLWRFLKALVVLSLDLGTATSHTEAGILSLLAHTAVGTGEPRVVARATWLSLLDEAGAQRQQAGDVRYELLPRQLREAHSAIPSTESRTLAALVQHGRVVRSAIQSTIDGIALDRTEKSSELLSGIAHGSQIVTGVAGAGKSALVDRVLTKLEVERPVLAFQAVEFARPHLNDVLMSAGGDIRIGTLLAVLAAHDNVVILIDAVERLLEHPVRDAFKELLAQVKEHPSIRVVATCRDYSLETVRSALFGQVSLEAPVLQVAAITDSELDELARALPRLAVPLRDPYLRSFLRTPYLLGMAARLQWTDETLPADAREFRQKCWREIVRDEAHQRAGMHVRRGQLFIDIARRRASELRPYVSTAAADAEVVTALRADSLLVQPPDSDVLAAPAHDVLEDWAILKWFDESVIDVDDVPATLSAMVSGLPAIRRGLRRWLVELLEVDPSTGRNVVLSVMGRTDLPSYFRDDCIVAVLLSGSARDFVASCRPRVRDGDLALLRQIIHMLRVGCKEAPFGLPSGALPSTFLIPVGDGWAATLELVADTVEALLPADTMLLLGFVEEWARLVVVEKPMPDGASAVGRILEKVVPVLEEYHDHEALTRSLEVLLKVPAEASLFRELTARVIAGDRHDYLSREFADLLITKSSGAFASCHLPEEVVRVARARLMLTEADAGREYHHSMEVAEFFGIYDRSGDFFPASAWRGPFRTLLRYHPQEGVKFILQLMNHAADWYERYRPDDRLEPAQRIVLDVPGRGAVTQWFSWRFYALHRGMHVGPFALQSALMALEDWLLAAARDDAFDLDGWLLHILTQSNSVMATGVVVSLCLAYPERAVHASLALLSSPELILIDKSRMAQESSVRAEFLAGLNPSHALYEQERRKANALPHRKSELESLALHLQSTEHREAVWQLIDRHRGKLAAAPAVGAEAERDSSPVEAGETEAAPERADTPEEAQPSPDTDREGQGASLTQTYVDERIWRLALHRMDVRGFRVVAPPTDAATVAADGSQLIYLAPGELEPDVQEMVDASQRRMADFSRHISLLNDARKAWENSTSDQLEHWRQLLASARNLADEGEPNEEYLRGGPGIVAAVGIRDHLEALSKDELAWCASRVQSELAAPPITSNDYELRRQSVMFGPDRAAAAVSLILASRVPEVVVGDPLDFVASVLTHPIDEIVKYAYEGAAAYATERDGGMLLKYASAAVADAEESEAIDAERRPVGRFGVAEVENVPERMRAAVRVGLNRTEDEVWSVLHTWPIRGWARERAASRVCRLLRNREDWQEARDFFLRAADVLASTWADARRNRGQGQRDFHGEYDLTRVIAQFALKLDDNEAQRLCAPFIALVDSEPRETERFLRELIVQADRNAHDSFWALWQAYADSIVGARWVDGLSGDRAYGAGLVERVFLNISWTQGVTHWRRLTGESHRLDALIQRLPAGVGSLEPYTRFLYTVGRQSLPAAFVLVSAALERGDSLRMASNREIAFGLEALLSQYVYGQPYRLKSDPSLRKAVLVILDALVLAGSSAAYRMRDDFVTPLGATAA